jgi:hypothetical protein
MRQSRLRARLRSTAADQLLVLTRRSELGTRYSGYVLAVGSKWVLLARTADGEFFDGHIAFRLTDLHHVRNDTSFESRAAQLRPEWPPRIPKGLLNVDLDRTRNVLKAFGADGSIIAVQKDRRLDLMWVGVVDEIRRHWVYLREVRPTGDWKDQPLGYRLRRIAVIERNGQYLRGLADVAGTKPPATSTSKE